MIRFKAILLRVIKELLRDKRTLALMLIAPLLVLTLMNFVFNSTEDTTLNIGVDQNVPSEIIESFPDDKVNVSYYSDKETIDGAKQLVQEENLDAYIALDGDTFHITYSNEDPSKTGQVTSLFSRALSQDRLAELSEKLKELAIKAKQPVSIQSFDVKSTYVYGDKDSTFFDKLFPMLIGFFVFFFVFLISGIALLKERTSGTLERLLATPIKRSEIVMGYLVGYGLFAVIQTLLIVFYSIYLLNVEVVGSIWLVILANILLSLVALSMGIFISTFANSEFQMVQFIPIIVIPQIFFSGLIPLDSMSTWLRNISYIFPLSYAGDVLSNVMIKGEGLEVIWPNLCVLVLFIIVFTSLNIIGLKRYRKV